VVEEASAIEAVVADAGSAVDEARRGGEEASVIEVAGEDFQEAVQGEDLATEVAAGEGLIGVVGLGVEGRRDRVWVCKASRWSCLDAWRKGVYQKVWVWCVVGPSGVRSGYEGDVCVARYPRAITRDFNDALGCTVVW